MNIASLRSSCRVIKQRSAFRSRHSFRSSAFTLAQDRPEVKQEQTKDKKIAEPPREEPKKPRKTQIELDNELRAAMEGRAGDGGLAGAELEGGQAVGMKRSVRENMFRYI